MTVLFALDLGTTTGWALVQYIAGKQRVTSGTQPFKPQRFEGGGMRYLKFTRWLDEMHKLSGGFTHIAFEEVRNHVSTDSAHAYGGFMATLTAWCEAWNVPYEGVPVGTIKKNATGKGNASKEAMILAARVRGHDPIDDNEADALAITYWMLDNESPSTSDIRPSLHGQPKRRLQVAPVRLSRRPVSR